MLVGSCGFGNIVPSLLMWVIGFSGLRYLRMYRLNMIPDHKGGSD